MDPNEMLALVEEAEQACIRAEWSLALSLLERFVHAYDRGAQCPDGSAAMNGVRRSLRLSNRTRYVASHSGALGHINHTAFISEDAACVAAAKMCPPYGRAIVVEVPPGESEHFDGVRVFECRRGRLA